MFTTFNCSTMMPFDACAMPFEHGQAQWRIWPPSSCTALWQSDSGCNRNRDHRDGRSVSVSMLDQCAPKK